MIDFSRLDAANRPLNAFLDWDPSAGFGSGSLSGVTVGVKANIAVRGMAWHAGIEGLRNRQAEADAETVACLRGAGAAIIGTLNMEEGALGAKTDNPWFGATQNPHRIGYTPGGSSGGSAAAVASGLCDVALGTDTMGSVRIPAAYCGVYGFKPANDRVSRHGLEIAEASLDCIGPIARSLDLLETVARVMSLFGDRAAEGVKTLADLGGVRCDTAVLGGYERALGASTGATTIGLAHPLSRIRFAGFVATARSLARHLSDVAPLSPALEELLTYGTRRSHADWDADRTILHETRTVLSKALADGAMLLLPSAPQAAFPHLEAAPANQADFTCLANIAGCAAISIPAGWSDDGLPVGVQLVSEPGREAGLFAAARRLDAVLGAYRPPKTLSKESPHADHLPVQPEAGHRPRRL